MKLTLNFGGRPSDTTSAFLKIASADGYFLYDDDFDAAITITHCQISKIMIITECKHLDLRSSIMKIKNIIANDPHVLMVGLLKSMIVQIMTKASKFAHVFSIP